MLFFFSCHPSQRKQLHNHLVASVCHKLDVEGPKLFIWTFWLSPTLLELTCTTRCCTWPRLVLGSLSYKLEGQIHSGLGAAEAKPPSCSNPGTDCFKISPVLWNVNGLPKIPWSKVIYCHLCDGRIITVADDQLFLSISEAVGIFWAAAVRIYGSR